ncbi:MAG: polysaccharide pyruvyl transferase family protein [Melioribacteraceae bacterium]
MTKRNIFLFKAEGKENFGEYLCKSVIQKMGFGLNNYSNVNQITEPIDYIMTGIGGFLNNEIHSLYLTKAKKWYVWGSGVHCIPLPWHKLSEDIIKNKCIITALRGPMTRDYYGIKDDITLGDAGYLASYFFKFPVNEKKKNVLINHHYDNVKKPMKGIDIHISSLMDSDINGSFDNQFKYILNSICNANIVMTSSMHVAIVAYSYGIPFAMVAKRETDLVKEWKWHDTLLNMGITKKIVLCESIEDGWAWWNSVQKDIRPITKEYQGTIIKAFPVIL